VNNKSHYLENSVINHFLRNSAVTSPTTVYVALFTVTPTKSTAGTEVTAGGYARTAVTMGAPTGGVATNSAPCTFPAATALWGTILGAAIFDDPTAGNMLYFGDLAASKTIDNGDTASFGTGTLTVNET
jgi:hypothetical protein